MDNGAKRFAEAEAGYRVALASSPDDSYLLSDLGLLLFDTGRPEEALTVLDAAIRARPIRLRPRFDRARVLAALGREEEAMAALETGIRRGITDHRWVAPSLRMLADLKRRAGNEEAARVVEGLVRARSGGD